MGQFANDKATPAPITVNRDKYNNEIPSDKPMHDNTTAGEGAFGWNEGHYDDDPGKGGFSGYGQAVSGTPGSSERLTVDASRADRGKES